MQKGVMLLVISFVLLGMLLTGFVAAQTNNTTDSSNSGSSSDNSGSDSTDDSDASDDSDEKDEDETDEADDDDREDRDKARERIREKIEREKDRFRDRFEREIRAADGSRIRVERFVEVDGDEVKVKIRKRITNADGTETDRVLVVERDSDDFKAKIKIEGVDGIEVETDLEIDDEITGDESDIAAVTSDGERTDIKILPDRAREIALEKLRARELTRIELDEVRHRDEIRAVYRAEAEKEGRFLGLFKLKLKLDSLVDPETGEVLDTEKPWWAFLVSGEDSDQTQENTEDANTDSTDTAQ